MAVTSGSFNQGSPDKHIVGGKASGPAATGDYNSVGSPSAASTSTDDAAADIYGAPGDATRMSRMKNLADEALSETPNGISGADNACEAFIDGATVSSFTSVSGSEDNPNGFSGGAYPSAASTPGSPGFPGLPDQPAAQGKQVSASKAVTASSGVSNNPAVKGSPGFPGLP